MSKITLNNVGSLLDATTAATTINDNSAVIVAAMDNTLSRDGTSPNQMGADLDMNSHNILNANSVTTKEFTLNGVRVEATDLASLDQVADGEIFSNVSGNTAIPTGNTLTEVLDHSLGNTQGSLIYRDATSWNSILPGTNGQVLRTNGTGQNPSWMALSGGGDLVASNNLSDLSNQNTANNNLGVFDSRASVVLYNIPSSVQFIATNGYYTLGDGGNATYKRVASAPSHPGKIQSADGAWWEIYENKLNVLMFGAKRDTPGFDCRQAFLDCRDTIVAQTSDYDFKYSGNIYVPTGQYETSDYIFINAPGMKIIGDGSVNSVIKASDTYSSEQPVIWHSPPNTTTVMVGVGLIGIGIDCNEKLCLGYRGESVYDNVVYDDVRISRIHADMTGFHLRPEPTNSIDVCQTIDIRSLFVAKYTQKGTVPAVLLDKCQEVTISCSKAWNGFGTDVDRGTAASWFLQDCQAVTMIGCSYSSSLFAGLEVYANTRNTTEIVIISPTFENIAGYTVYSDSSNSSLYTVQNLVVISPRHESPVTGIYNINATVRGYIESGAINITLGSSTFTTIAFADDLSQITNSGSYNTIKSRCNAVSDFEGFRHNISVRGASGTKLETRTAADGETSISLGYVPSGSSFTTGVVVVGPPDSGGAGFRALRVVN
jgi:hypothetical protein